jgi:hypothetical protein
MFRLRNQSPRDQSRHARPTSDVGRLPPGVSSGFLLGVVPGQCGERRTNTNDLTNICRAELAFARVGVHQCRQGNINRPFGQHRPFDHDVLGDCFCLRTQDAVTDRKGGIRPTCASYMKNTAASS